MSGRRPRARRHAPRRTAGRSVRRRGGARLRRWLAPAGFGLGLGIGLALGRVGLVPLAVRMAPESLAVRELSVLGQQRLDAAEIARAAALPADFRVGALEPGEIAQRVAAHPWIRAARVAAFPPGRVVVAVEERRPEATIELRGPGPEPSALWWVDAEGVPFAPVETAPLDPDGASHPRITGVPDAAPRLAHPRLAEGVRLAGAARRHGLPEPREIGLGDDVHAAPTLRLHATRAQVLLGAGELDAKLARLADLLAAGLTEVETASAIDLRFGDRMVLRSDSAPDGGEAAGAHGGGLRSGDGPTG